MTIEGAKLKKKLNGQEQEVRLVNWGRWHRHDDTLARLAYPTWPQIMRLYWPAPGGPAVAELDAEHLEHVISTLDIAGRGGFGWGELYAFCLRIEYIERPTDKQRPPSERARFVREKFKRPCAVRTYHHHVQNAKRAVFALAGPI